MSFDPVNSLPFELHISRGPCTTKRVSLQHPSHHPYQKKKKLTYTADSTLTWPTQYFQMASDDNVDEDKELEKLLAQLQVSDKGKKLIDIPEYLVETKNWRKCVLMQVMVDWRVAVKLFTQTIRSAWDIQYNINVEPKERNTFLVEFASERDIQHVLHKDIALFRNELVALRRVTSEADATSAEVNSIDLWVQLHGAILSRVAPQGIPKLLADLGTPVSDAQQIFFRDMRAYRIRLNILLDKRLWDRVEVRNSLIGDGTVYLVYEKVPKICLFCAKLGHLMATCSLRAQIMQRRSLDVERENEILWKIPEQLLEDWVMDKTKLPIMRSRFDCKLHMICRNPKEFQGLKGWCKERKVMSARGTTKSGCALQEIDALDDEDVISSRKRMVKMDKVNENDMEVDPHADEDEACHVKEDSLNSKRARRANPNSPSSSP